MTTINLQSFCVKVESGEIDIDATCQKFYSEVVNYKTERELEAEAVGNAIHAVFDRYRGTRLNMPALSTYAFAELNGQPENHATLDERIRQYVRDNSGTQESGAAFGIGKGKNGGVIRWSDAPPPKTEG